MHLNGIKAAVEKMEIALGFDPGDGTIFAQFGYLRRKLKRGKRRYRGQWLKERSSYVVKADDSMEENELPLVGFSRERFGEGGLKTVSFCECEGGEVGFHSKS